MSERQMILIAHRGNVSGKGPRENWPAYVVHTLAQGYDVEVDVWYREGWFLGHDEPTYGVSEAFLLQPGVWCHAKSWQALSRLSTIGAHCFWHEHDECGFTSKGYVWMFPRPNMLSNTICVLPEPKDYPLITDCAGVCADDLKDIKRFLESQR